MNIASWWFVGVVLALAAVAWVEVVRPRGVLRRVRALVAWTAVVVTVAGIASGVNAYFGYLPHVGDLAETVSGQSGRVSFDHIRRASGHHPRGVVVDFPIPDRGSGFGASSALVWLPPQYFTSPAARFPVVYLFHGSPGVPADWFEGGQAAQAGLAAAGRGRPAIIVAPRMSHGWLEDPECVDGIHDKIDTHFVRDVVPTVDDRLRTVAERDDRVFGGMSAGGYCALQLGLTHRDLAATVIDMSGLTAPTHADGPKALFGDDPHVLPQRLAATSPAIYASSLPPGPPLRIWFDVGASDAETRGPITAIAPVLQSRGVDTQVHIRPGEHTFHVWVPALRAALPWALTPFADTDA